MNKTLIVPHVCVPDRDCTCDHVSGLEPSESCPRHGVGVKNPQCAVCGKYVAKTHAPRPARTVYRARPSAPGKPLASFRPVASGPIPVRPMQAVMAGMLGGTSRSIVGSTHYSLEA